MRPHTDPQRVEENPQQTHQSARKFLQTLENAAYAREENPQQATLVRELVNSLSSGKLLLMPTDVVWNLDEDTQEEKAIAKLDALIELVISMRMRWNANRSLGTLEGDMTESEAWATAQELLSSMSTEERRAYAFCFQTNRSHQFFFALLRQPSFFNAGGLEKLLGEWTSIKNSSEYKETLEERKRRTELQTQPMAELQNLRKEINRKRQNREDTQDLLLELRKKEESYNSANQLPLGAKLNRLMPQKAEDALQLLLDRLAGPQPMASPPSGSSRWKKLGHGIWKANYAPDVEGTNAEVNQDENDTDACGWWAFPPTTLTTITLGRDTHLDVAAQGPSRSAATKAADAATAAAAAAAAAARDCSPSRSAATRNADAAAAAAKAAYEAARDWSPPGRGPFGRHGTA